MMHNINYKNLSKDELIAMARYIVKHPDSSDNVTYSFDDTLYTYFAHDDNGIKCDNCGETFRPDEVIEMLDGDGKIIHKCHSCNGRWYSFYKCPVCGKYHEHHGRFDELTLLPTLNDDDAKKCGISTGSNSQIPIEKLDILKDFGFSDAAIETIRKYYGMHICKACAKKHGIRDTRNAEGVLEDGCVWMMADATKNPMSKEENDEVHMTPLDRLFKKFNIVEFAKTKYSDPQVRTKSLLVKLIDKYKIR